MIFLLRFFLQNLNFKNILPTGIKILLRIFPTGCDLIFWFLFVGTGAFAFGGEGEQAKRLEEDGVEVKNGKVDLKKFGINSN